MNRSRQNSPTTWVEFVYELINTKRGLILIGFVLIAITVVLSLIIYLWSPDKVEVTTNAGTIAIKKGSTQNAVLMLSASGSKENKKTPWSRTGIMVKNDDKIKIQASGRVHTALKKLITIAETDEQILPSWVGPNGSGIEEEKDWDTRRESRKLMPDNDSHHGYGKLLAGIRNEDGKVGNLVAVGEEREWNIKEKGELVLAVNDILLAPEARDIYALPLKDNYLYYETQVEEEERLRKENGDFVPNKTLQERVKEAYQRRLNTWNEDIVPKGNWMVWYDDNIGAFSVSVTIN